MVDPTTYDLSSFQYAFSTIAQTIATGFALLTAVVMYQLQALTSTFDSRSRTVESALEMSGKQGEANRARDKGDWDKWKSVTTGLRPKNRDTRESQNRRDVEPLDDLHADIEKTQSIRHDTKVALTWTGYTIAVALIMIPIINRDLLKCFPLCVGVGAWITVLADTILAIYCLRKFSLMVLGVIAATSTVPPTPQPPELDQADGAPAGNIDDKEMPPAAR